MLTSSERVRGSYPPIAMRNSPFGPITQRRSWRTLGVYLLIALAGFAAVLADASHGLQAFGLGLIFPGGGFAYTGDWIALAITILFSGVGFGLWLDGNPLAIPSVWIGAAVLAGVSAGSDVNDAARWIIPALTLAILLAGFIYGRLAFIFGRRRGREWNATADSREPITVRSSPGELGPELSADDLAHLRYLLDRALQPLDEWNGFDKAGSAGLGPMRYQLTFAESALAVVQYAHLPAFHGYMAEAQRNLIEKMFDRSVWGYWQHMNMTGNLSSNPDPIVHQNVMYSGYLGSMLGFYAASTDDRRYNEPGSIHLEWKNGEKIEYDYKSLCETLAKQHLDATYTLIACSPWFVYPLCNNYSFLGMISSDQINGTNYGERLLPKYEKAMNEEFMTVEGHFITVRSTTTGMSMIGRPSMTDDSICIWTCHPVLPELAERTWEINRARRLTHAKDGQPKFNAGPMKLDLGNNRPSTVGAVSLALAAAKEVGDQEAYDDLQTVLESKTTPVMDNGELRYEKASVMTHTFLSMARFGRPGAVHDMVRNGLPEAWRTGPILDAAPYPDVLVAKAVTDGSKLELVLRNGATTGRHKLKLARLRPGQRYRAQGSQDQELTADSDGTAYIEVDVGERTEVEVSPW